MNELLNTLPYIPCLAFAMTYLLHSSVWLLLVALLVKAPFFQTTLLKNYLWKAALIGGLATSVFTLFYGDAFYTITLAESNAKKEVLVENVSAVERPLFATIEEADIALVAAPVEIINTSAKPVICEKTVWADYLPMLLIFWLMGSLFLFFKMLGEHWCFFQKISPRAVVEDQNILKVFKKVQEKSKLHQVIKLTQSASLDSPILIRNREICLPEQAILEMDISQLEAMLAHELAHIARKDYYWTCGLALLEILFFFQPLYRWAKREINNSNELLCDTWAAQVTGNNLALAQCLLTVASWIKERPKNYALVAGMSLKKSELSNRVQSLIQFSNGTDSRFNLAKTGVLFVSLLIPILLVLPAFSFTELIESKVCPLKVEEEKTSASAIESTETTKNLPKACAGLSAAEGWQKHLGVSESYYNLLSEEKQECANLLVAVKANDLRKVERLLATSDANCMLCYSQSPKTPINAAARNNNIKIVKLLLESGADLYKKSHTDEGALLATAQNGNISLMQVLAAHGADFNYEFEGFGTALTTAIEHNQYEMARYLLSNGANLLQPLKNGKTALDYAQEKGGKIGTLALRYRATDLARNL